MGLMRRLVLGDLDLTEYPFALEFGGDFGSPQNVYDTLISMLADGDIVGSTRVTNREINLTVQVEGATLADLAANEALLIAESDKARNELMLDPGDDYAAAIVFETFRVQVTPVFDDDLEQANYRRYTLTVPARPYTRGVEAVVVPAIDTGALGYTVTPTYTLVDNGSSTTGWSSNATLSVVSGAIRATQSAHSPNIVTVSMERTGTVSFAGQQYITLDASWTVPWVEIYIVVPTGIGSAPVASLPLSGRVDLGGGLTRLFFGIPTSITSVSYFIVQIRGAWTTGADTFSTDQVQMADKLPIIGTARQKALSVVPGGTVRTQGSIQVAHATSSLGKTIVYTHPAGTGYLPPLRPWRVSGDTPTGDSTLLSGNRNTLVTPNDYNIPAANLPRGRVELWAWLRANSTTAFPLIWTVESWLNSVSLHPNDQTKTLSLAANTWTLVLVGAATMPPVDIGPSGYVRVKLQRDPGSSVVVDLDEAYLFATDQGRLTVVDCGIGSPAAAGPSNRLWIDAPSLTQPQGAIWRGNAADRSNAWHAGRLAEPWEVHDFEPAGSSIFVATQNALDAETSLEHYRRYHTHVAP